MSDSNEKPNKGDSFLAFLKEELKPYPGRLQITLRMVASVVLALWIDMTFDLPAIGLSLYLVFFVVRESQKASVKSLLLVVAGTGIPIILVFLIVSFSDGEPLVRFIAMTVITLVSMFLMHASTQAQLFLAIGLFGGAFLRSWDKTSSALQTVESTLWLAASINVGFACGVMVELLFAYQDPLHSLQKELSDSIGAVEQFFSSMLQGTGQTAAQKKLASLSAKGTAGLQALLVNAEQKRPNLHQVHSEISGSIQLIEILADQVTSLSTRKGEPLNEMDREAVGVLIRECQTLKRAFQIAKRPPSFSPTEQDKLRGTRFLAVGKTLAGINLTLIGTELIPEAEASAKKKKGFLKPDALSNKQYLISAMKTTAAAMVCYLLYMGADWPQIDTCVTTCIITSLGTEGATHEKQILRIGADTVAGLCGMAALCWILPHFTSIAGLTVVVAVMGFAGAWLYLSSPRLNYAGRQLSYCFFLATLPNNSTSTSLSEARDRVVGVLLGVTVMWLIFDQIAPVWTMGSIRSSLAGVMKLIKKIAEVRESEKSPAEKLKATAEVRASFAKGLNSIRTNLHQSGYELNSNRGERKELLPKIRHLCDLMQQLFVAELTSLEELAAGVSTDPGDSRKSAGDIDSLISQITRGTGQQLSPAPPQHDSESFEKQLLHEIQAAIQEANLVKPPHYSSA